MKGAQITKGDKLGFSENKGATIYAQKYTHSESESAADVWGTVEDIWPTKIAGTRVCEIKFPNGDTAYYGVNDNDEFVKEV